MTRFASFLLFFFLFAFVLEPAFPTMTSSLTLQQALQEARSNSPRLQKSRSQSEEVSWKKVESLSGFLPTLSLSANYLTDHRYLLTDISFGGNPTSIPAIVPTSNLMLTAQLPVFDGFASTHRYKSAEHFERAAQKEVSWAEFQTDRDITLLFYRALAAGTLKQVAEQNLKTLQDHLDDVKQFRKAGLSTNFDVLRVEVQVSEAQSEILNSTDNMEISQNKLAEILGTETESRGLQGELPVLGPQLIQNLSLDSIPQRADLEALQERSEGFHSLQDSSGRYWVPRINLFGQYQYYNNRNDRFQDWDNYREAHQMGVSLVWNLFDGMVSTARSKQSIEQRFQAEKTLQMARLKARQDLDIWQRKFLYFCSVYRSRVSDVQKSTESVRLAKEGRRAGSRTNTELLDSETELFRARAGLVNAQIGAIEALINLELATGQKLYEFQ